MWAVFTKEVRQFFSSLTGYIAILVFLLLTALLLFVFPETNMIDFGYASLGKFFDLAPWIFSLLVPAITMRSLSDELRTGTYEILKTRPLTSGQLVLGKYLATLLVVTISLVPTLVYWYSMHALSGPAGLDRGATTASYIGLLLLAAVFSGIGILSSSLTSNPVVAFLTAGVACLLFYNGFSALSKLPVFASGADYYVEMLGIDFHYRSISRGVLDSRDLIYFLSLIGLCLWISQKNMERR